MFESHPIPQQISSYQFRLVGDMTLKQFFQLAGGVLVSLLFYSTGLHPIIKWPLVILSSALGAALAFLPFEERPLSNWLMAFFRSIYSPTIFSWVKTPANTKFFADENKTNIAEKIIAPQGEAAMNQYLSTLPQQKEAPVAKLDNEEKTFIQKISSLFSSFTPGKPDSPPPSTPAVNISTNTPTDIPVINQPVNTDVGSTTQTVIQTPFSQPANDMAIPTNQPVAVPVRPKITVEETTTQPQPVNVGLSQSPAVQTGIPVDQSVTPTFSNQAAPPSPPMIPNTISGQILDPEGKIVEGAILEIRDIAGRPVRALRSNKAGHFMVVTALSNGDYQIITEKNGYEFEPVSFKAQGEMIPPILIKAKSVHPDENAPYTGKPLIIN